MGSEREFEQLLERFAVFGDPSGLLVPAVKHDGVSHPHALCPSVASDDSLVPLRGTLQSVPVTSLLNKGCFYCYGSLGRQVYLHVVKSIDPLVSLLESLDKNGSCGHLLCMLTPENPLISPEAASQLLAHIKPCHLRKSGYLTFVLRSESNHTVLENCFHHSVSGFSLFLADPRDYPHHALSKEIVSLDRAVTFARILDSLFPQQIKEVSDAAQAALALC